MADDDKTTGSEGERMDLPTWNRSRTKKKRRKAGPEDDAFQATVRKSGRKAVDNTRLTIIVVVVVLAAIVAGVVIYDRQRTRAASSTKILSEAVGVQSRARVGEPETTPEGKTRLPPYPLLKEESERASRVQAALDNLASEAPGSGADVTAELVRAAANMRIGAHPEAIKYYRGFLERSDEEHPLNFLAREGLGFALEATGDLDGALREYQILAAEKGAFYRDAGLGHQGRVLEALGRDDEALAVYRTYNEEYPQSSNSLAREHVRARLEVLDPAALQAPPADDAAPEGEAEPGGAP